MMMIETITRRTAVVGAASLAAVGCATSETGTADDRDRTTTARARMPVAYVPHGGGPWPFVDLGIAKHEHDALAEYLRSLRSLAPATPKALLVVSAHWEAPVPTVMTSPRPPMLFDYYGFPPKSYELDWPAPGDPVLAQRVQALLEGAGIPSASDDRRGFDHGTFIPFMLPWPDADVPTLQLSLKAGLDPKEHLAIGRALAPLRDEGVLVLGSGMSFHNLRAFGSPQARTHAEAFDAWLGETATHEADTRDSRLLAWADAPSARLVHPREEHLIPLMVVAGAAGNDRGTIPYSDTFMGMRISAYHFG